MAAARIQCLCSQSQRSNTGSLEGGPRLIFQNGQVLISRVELGIYRTGTNALAGLDPIPDCFEDPNICTDAYGNYAELDLGKAIMNGLDQGSSGGILKTE